MSVTRRRMQCSPSDVAEVVADGWLFPAWVVGASRMRAVDDAWPAVGSQLHHSFGSWPVLIDDATTMLEWDPPRRMVMQPKGWPIGEARVTLEMRTLPDGCEVRMTEEAVRGPGRLVPAPVMDLLLHARNVETLRRLAYLAEGRRAGRD
ncbi:SRPBCC family protein [Clavibacter michiganensis subsp. phaseoli]|uniref:SRPBCC family protein n=1 Tax=Clavibacter phaseoli TaxID=1734031 RepID=A0A8I0S8Z2_9MICO|nr:SRPBCC family protein [Clavibacter phaseoli]MBF4629923.1 SRPBCC family protein [Clavibacter phaseoli]